MNAVKVTLGFSGIEHWHQMYFDQEYDLSRIMLVLLFQVFVELEGMIW